MGSLLNLLTLKPLKGSRSQFTIIAGILLNSVLQILKALNIVDISEEEIGKINSGLTVLFAYFMADKLSKDTGDGK